MTVSAVKLERGSSALLAGPARLSVASGSVSVFGATLKAPSSFTAVAGRQYPVTALEDAELELSLGRGARFEPFDGNPIPDDWRRAAERVSALAKSSVVVIGDVDSGKSGFTLYTANALVSRGKRVAIVDTDVGQSDIGPPGTIGMALLERQYASYPDVPLADAYFVGDKTPAGHLLPMVVGAKEMVDRALSLGADVVLVNTTGMVHGGVAAALKYYKIEVLKPALLVALQRASEVEHLLKPHEGRLEIVRLRTPEHVAKRERGARAEFRSLRMGYYLAGSKSHAIDLAKVTLLNTSIGYGEHDDALASALQTLAGRAPSLVTRDGRSVTVVFDVRLHPAVLSRVVGALRARFDHVRVVCTPRLRGLLIGLYDSKHRFLCAGTLEELKVSGGKLRVRAPLDDPSRVRYVYLGYLILDEEGNEKATIRPGEI